MTGTVIATNRRYDWVNIDAGGSMFSFGSVSISPNISHAGQQPAPGAVPRASLRFALLGKIQELTGCENGDDCARCNQHAADIMDELPLGDLVPPAAPELPASKTRPELGELTIAVCEIPGHAPHAARITVDYGLQVTSFCLPPEHAAFLGDALASKKPAAAKPGELGTAWRLLEEVRERTRAAGARWLEQAAMHERDAGRFTDPAAIAEFSAKARVYRGLAEELAEITGQPS